MCVLGLSCQSTHLALHRVEHIRTSALNYIMKLPTHYATVKGCIECVLIKRVSVKMF